MNIRHLTFNEYDNDVAKFNVCPRIPKGLPGADLPIYEAMGAAGEAGEALEKVKKGWRDGEFDRAGFIKELGDQLWYINEAAKIVGFTLEEVAIINIQKLTNREARGKIHGSGDNR